MGLDMGYVLSGLGAWLRVSWMDLTWILHPCRSPVPVALLSCSQMDDPSMGVPWGLSLWTLSLGGHLFPFPTFPALWGGIFLVLLQ